MKTIDRDVINVMEQEHESRGDYVEAARILQKTVLQAQYDELVDSKAATEEAVKERLEARIKMAEMYWRYKVVEEGESPRDKAVEVLEQCTWKAPPEMYRIR